jgi:16S rRNA processing protein RimM
MHTISIENCINAGYIQKPHGVFGTLLLNFPEGMDERIEDTTVFYIETEGLLVPWFTIPDGVRITSSKTALIDLEWIDSEAAAKKVAGKKVWIDKDLRNDNHSSQGFTEWIGYRVIETGKGLIGNITEVNDYSGNIVITVARESQTYLIPFHEDLIIAIDNTDRSVTMHLPEGITDI